MKIQFVVGLIKALLGKLAVASNQGAANAGKVLGVDTDGSVITVPTGEAGVTDAGDVAYVNGSGYTSGSAGAAMETMEGDVTQLKSEINGMYGDGSADGANLFIEDAVGGKPLKSLTSETDGTAYVAGRNMISADFTQTSTKIEDVDERVFIGKGGYDYAFPSRISDVVLNGDKITFTVTAPQLDTTGVGIRVRVQPGHTYRLTYNKHDNGRVNISAYSDSAYVTNVKYGAGNGYTAKASEATEHSSVKYWFIAFCSTTQNAKTEFTEVMFEEIPYDNAEAHVFVPYQTKQAVTITDGEGDVSNVVAYAPETHVISYAGAALSVHYFQSPVAYANSIKIETENDVKSKMFVSGYNDLDGWEPHAKAFAEMMEDVEDTEGFMFFTDTHFMSKQTESAWKEYAYAIFAYLEQLYYASPCSFVLHGGDWLGTGDTRANALYKLSTLSGVFRSRFDRYALLVGNHETGTQMVGNTAMTHGTLAATLLANAGKTYYRFDANTFRLYCFDSWTAGTLDAYAGEQIAWFANALKSETAAHIAIAIHILYDEETLKGIGDELTKCAAAYNSRSTYTYDGVTYNFADATGKVAFVIAGHNHADATGTVNGIPYILTVNTTGYSDTNFGNLPLPVDLIRVDWENKKLTAYRAARGTAGTTREMTIL